MNRINKFIAGIVLCFLSVAVAGLWADDQVSNAGDSNKKIVVEIDYGGICPSRTVEAPWTKDRTVLEVLQTVAEVKTHPVGEHVFVTSIDGVEGKRGKMAWYYTVGGESEKKLAYSNVLDNNAEPIRWIYKKDVCSKKVDGEI